MNTELWSAISAALAERGVRAEVLGEEVAAGDRRIDALVELTARGVSRRYAAEMKRTVGTATIATLHPVPAGLPTLLLTSHVTRGIAAQCRALGIEFADAAGNMYVDLGSILIDVEGRRPHTQLTATRTERLFQPSGLKVLFALLCDPGLVDAPLRVLADESGASLGSVHLVINELQDAGYVESTRAERRLHRTRRLFDQWTEAYDTNLRAKLSLGTFDSDEPHRWLGGGVNVTAWGALWGGEVAAALLDRHLRAGRATVYTDGLPRELIRQYRLRRVDGPGSVEFRERFWGHRVAATGPQPCVPMPLVYADLAASGEARQIEAAGRLRERDEVLRRIDAT